MLRIHISTSYEGIRQAAALDFASRVDISFDTWNFYNDDKRRELLFDLEEAGAIARIYDPFNIIGNENLPGYAITRGREAVAEVEDRLLDGSLDKSLYRRVCTPDAWNHMARLLEGSRESERKTLSPF